MQASRFWQEATKAKRRALADLGLQGLLAKIAEPKTTTFHVVERVTEEEPKISVVRFHVEEAQPAPIAGNNGVLFTSPRDQQA